MKTRNILMSMLVLLMSTNLVHAGEIVSGGLHYEVNQDIHSYSSKESGFYAGQQVKNHTLDIEGKLSGSIVLKSNDHHSLSFTDSDAEIIKIGKGFWLLSYPQETELGQKVEWLMHQPGVLKAEIEVSTNLLKLQ
ncbi:hypothetical protein [Veronia pacifica]|uniref:Uncharacterized protein n=1 Tax=Veronia pacifica TaxID=1080227 RepID=A0A1C3E920_9GAMM|nr:hypothetical protein [Veronia pacifica]ODA29767.1 hypothetical protein A8L45_21820 [Veronia pacifica]